VSFKRYKQFHPLDPDVADSTGDCGALFLRLAVGRALTKLSGDLIRGNDLRFEVERAKSSGKSSRDAAHGKSVDGRTDVTLSCDTVFKHQGIQVGEVVSVHERPAYILTCHNPDCPTLHGVASKAAKYAGRWLVDHGGMPDDGVKSRRVQDALNMRDRPRICRKGSKRTCLGREIVAGFAEHPTAPGINESDLLRLRRKMWQERVEETAVSVAHGIAEIGSHMDDCTQWW
jgi:hypothetical protein